MCQAMVPKVVFTYLNFGKCQKVKVCKYQIAPI